ncbi:hypothetical protein V8F06_007164 [Rhypophila decipiens]
MAVGTCERRRTPALPVHDSKRKDFVLLRQGVDIALAYFTFGQKENIQKLTIDAKEWCLKYYKGYYYAPKRATGLLKAFPNLFNLNVEPHRRITIATMKEPAHSEPEGASRRELRRAERKAANSEAFPEFAEPTLATDEEIDEIVDLRPRIAAQQPRVKPNMRVDAAMLRGSGLLHQLPEFLGQLARANLETETLLATNPEAVRFELDENAPDDEPHIEMNLFAGVAEAQRRRHARRIVLPNGRPLNQDGDEEEDGEGYGESCAGDSDDSGDESDASTSTIASLRVRQKKRKAGDMLESDDDGSQPNKIRLQYQHPTPVLAAFDMSTREIVRKANPLASIESDPFVKLARKRKADDDRLPPDSPSRSSSGATSDSSSSSNKRIKIKLINRDSSSGSSQASTTSGSSRDNSRTSTPEFRIIRLPDSQYSSSSSSSSGSPSSTRSSPRIKIVRRNLRSVSPTAPLAGASGDHEQPRPSSSSSNDSFASSGSGKSTGSGRTKIKLIKSSAQSIPRR